MKRIELTVSGKVTVGALVAMAAIHLLTTLLLTGEYPVFALVFELPLLVLAALLATGRRWAAPVGAALSALFFMLTLAGSMTRLTQPRNPAFLSVVLFLILALVATIAGIRVTVENYRGE